MKSGGNDTEGFHQGANAVAFIAIFLLWNYGIVSGGAAFLMMVALVGLYAYVSD